MTPIDRDLAKQRRAATNPERPGLRCSAAKGS
jgi:hypothetical protein